MASTPNEMRQVQSDDTDWSEAVSEDEDDDDDTESSGSNLQNSSTETTARNQDFVLDEEAQKKKSDPEYSSPDRYESIEQNGLFVRILINKSKGKNLLGKTQRAKFKEYWSKILPNGYDRNKYYFEGKNLEAMPSTKMEKSVKYYDKFVQEIVKEIKRLKPGFVFFYISSHGNENGTFQLSSTSDVEPCPRDHQFETIQQYKAGQASEHKHQCHSRSFDVLVARIQDVDVLLGVPKIFIGEFCRSGVNKTDIKSVTDPGTKKYLGTANSATYFHLSKEADTIILYSTVANRISYSLSLLESLADAVEEMNDRADLKVVKSVLADAKPKLRGKLYEEDLVGGWLTNVFGDVQRKVGLNKVTSRKKTEIVPKDKQIPEIVSTLTQKLSALDIFSERRETQTESEHTEVLHLENNVDEQSS